jgi:hypothetical protein
MIVVTVDGPGVATAPVGKVVGPTIGSPQMVVTSGLGTGNGPGRVIAVAIVVLVLPLRHHLSHRHLGRHLAHLPALARPAPDHGRHHPVGVDEIVGRYGRWCELCPRVSTQKPMETLVSFGVRHI